MSEFGRELPDGERRLRLPGPGEPPRRRGRPGPFVVAEPLPAAISLARAEERRQRVAELDDDTVVWREDFWSEGFLSEDEPSARRPPRREPREPQDSPARPPRDPGWLAAEAVRREYQSSSVPLLLGSRVNDTVITRLDDMFDGDSRQSSWMAAVHLGYQCVVRRRPVPDGTIGYFVQIETLWPEFVVNLFRGVPPAWLGIETVVVQANPPVPLGGARGQIGGYLTGTAPDGTTLPMIGMTCHHVDSLPTFIDLYQSISSAPDAKLVKVDEPPAAATRVEIADHQSVLRLMQGRMRLVRAPRPGRDGYVAEPLVAFPGEERPIEFPSVRILPLPSRVLGMFNWPPWAVFSRKGDSGSWVVDPADMAWVGMVAYGRDQDRSTYAHQAAALYKLASRVLRDHSMACGETRSVVRR